MTAFFVVQTEEKRSQRCRFRASLITCGRETRPSLRSGLGDRPEWLHKPQLSRTVRDTCAFGKGFGRGPRRFWLGPVPRPHVISPNRKWQTTANYYPPMTAPANFSPQKKQHLKWDVASNYPFISLVSTNTLLTILSSSLSSDIRIRPNSSKNFCSRPSLTFSIRCAAVSPLLVSVK